MLAIITDDVAGHGFVGFSLRRAAAVVGTTHKVLLYQFRDAEDLMAQVADELRGRRIDKGVAATLKQAGPVSSIASERRGRHSCVASRTHCCR